MSKTVYVLNGPNLNLLGQREPEIYGRDTLADVEARCRALADAHGMTLVFRQTNREYEMVDWIQEARKSAGIVINPAGFSYHAVPVLATPQDRRHRTSVFPALGGLWVAILPTINPKMKRRG